MRAFPAAIRKASTFDVVGEAYNFPSVVRWGLRIPNDVFKFSIVGHETQKVRVWVLVYYHFSRTGESGPRFCTRCASGPSISRQG